MRNLTIRQAREHLFTRDQLNFIGWRESALRRALSAGELRRVRRNRYIDGGVWADLWPEAQHLVHVVAATEEMEGDSAVVSYASAAVLHALPLYRYRPPRVETTLRGPRRAASTAGVLRHDEPLPEEDITTVDGIVCTTLQRTVFDLARTLAWEAGVASADAAMRRATMNRRRLDPAAAEEWRARMSWRASHSPGARGVRQAARVVEFADGRAELPGESVSRVQLARLGFTDLDLQMPVASPSGRDYEVDIAIRQAKALWEFDGQGKYRDLALRQGRSLEEVLMDEKRREDWIRGKTQWRLARGEDAHIATPQAMAARLSAFGISPP